MQGNDNPFVALRQTLPLPDFHRLWRAFMNGDSEAQRFFEQKRHLESNTASRPLSQHSTLTGSSTNTISSTNPLPSNVPTSETDTLPSNVTATIDNGPSSSQVPARLARYLGGWNTSLFINRGPKQPPKPFRRRSSRGETPADSELECHFCTEIGFTPSFKRTQDVRKHLTKYHRENDLWICPQEDCRLAFDRENRFKDHFKQDHSRVPAELPDAQVKLHPQLVFACGFEMCRYILEATDEQDAVDKVVLYHDHIVNNHVGNNPQEKWSYARCLKNLMHQEGLKPYWRDRKKGQEGRWQPQIHTTFVLRKIIETRRYCDPVRLVQLVEDSGYPPHNNPESAFFPLPPGLSRPLEVDFSEDTSNDVTDGFPSALSVDHSVPPATISTDHGEFSINFQYMGPSCVSVSQNSGTTVPQSYGNDRHWGGYSQSIPFTNPTCPEEDTFGPYQANPFPVTHHLSQYPSDPLESNQGDHSVFHATGYHDNMAVDPRLLTLNQHHVADLSTNLETNYGPIHSREDHS